MSPGEQRTGEVGGGGGGGGGGAGSYCLPMPMNKMKSSGPRALKVSITLAPFSKVVRPT